MKRIKGRDGMILEVDDDYIIRDGESFTVPLTMMDSRSSIIHDSRGHVAGSRPGFSFADNEADDQAREAAYREYAATISERWRQPQGQRSNRTQPEPQPFANAEAARAAAYAEYNRAIQERWRK